MFYFCNISPIQLFRHQWHQWTRVYMIYVNSWLKNTCLLTAVINSGLPGGSCLFALKGIVDFHVTCQTQWVLNRTHYTSSNSPKWFQLSTSSFNWDQWKLLYLPIICLILHARIPEQLLQWPVIAFHLLFKRVGIASLSTWWMENQN